ncbi:hypothetical protein Bbelb_013510 [Branchiostoma belcheri]|nr:hypothetical protein Bbelb_013510 [Branchiostoma belcheri]
MASCLEKFGKKRLFLLVGFLVVVAAIIGIIVGVTSNQSPSASQGDSDEHGGDKTTKAPVAPTGTQTMWPPGSPWLTLRLPDYIVPLHYNLTLWPDLVADTFTGKVAIDLKVSQPTKYILLHINQLVLQTPTVYQKLTGASYAVLRTFEYLPNQFYVIEMSSEIPANNQNDDGDMYVVTVDFSGSLVGHIVGFYKSTYTNSQGETRSLATSKFQPTDARRAFPCFDEPALKAEFTVILIHQPQYIAISNMPIDVAYTRGDGLVETHFQRSVPMSSYLACFIVCDFKYTESVTRGGTPIRVYATPDQVNNTLYALDIMRNVTDYFEELFRIPYPLPKLDQIAIPDFVSGAMEHWGLITYRETNLLYEEGVSSAGNKQRVASVVAHELAHMWFGNIVTMEWWDDLWLNEGFASFVEYLGVNEAEPDWQMLDQFIVQDLQPVYGLDALTTSHPIILPVNRPEEITEIFDSISYSKGASVIRMLRSFLGETAFQTGITQYLTDFSYSTARTDDLWSALGAASNQPVKQIMDTWTKQMGFPVVHFRNTSSGLLVTQERCLVDRTADTSNSQYDSPYNYTWSIPLSFYQLETKDNPWNDVMDTKEVVITNWRPDSAKKWIIGNVNRYGYYRVTFDVDVWAAVTQQLQDDHLMFSAADRSGLLDDGFALARGGYLSYSVALDLTKYLDQEEGFLPWDTAVSSLSSVTNLLENTDQFDAWKNYCSSKVRSLADTLGFREGGTHLEQLQRSNVLGFALRTGDINALNNASAFFQRWLQGESVPSAFRSLVYRYGMQQDGDEAAWNYMWNKYSTETLAQDKIRLLYGLAFVPDGNLLRRLLEYSMDENLIRSQDFNSAVIYVSYTSLGLPIVWDWVREKWPELVNRFGLDSRALGRLVPSIVSGFSTDAELQEVLDFFALYPEAGAGARGREQALERIRSNIAWQNANLDHIKNWLQDNSAR